MVGYEFGKRYEIEEPASAADLIAKMTQGRLAPVVLDLHLNESITERVELVGAPDVAGNVVSFERLRRREVIRDFPAKRISAVTLVDTEPPLDRSDEIGR